MAVPLTGSSTAVTSADDFARRLRAMSRDISNQLGRANYKIGRKVVLDARAKAATVSRQAAKASKSARASNIRNGVAVAIGNSRYPFAAGSEFGSKRYHQFPPWTGNKWTDWPEHIGYWLMPTIRADKDYVLKEYLGAVQDAANAAGVPMGDMHELSALERIQQTIL